MLAGGLWFSGEVNILDSQIAIRDAASGRSGGPATTQGHGEPIFGSSCQKPVGVVKGPCLPWFGLLILAHKES